MRFTCIKIDWKTLFGSLVRENRSQGFDGVFISMKLIEFNIKE